MKQRHPDWGPDQIQAALELIAEDIADPGQDVKSGMGKVVLSQVLATLAAPPEEPAIWYDPLYPGSGVSIQGAGGAALAAWYAYDDASSQNVWHLGAGPMGSGILGPVDAYTWQGIPLGGEVGVSYATTLGSLTILFNEDSTASLMLKEKETNRFLTSRQLQPVLYGAPDHDPRAGYWVDPARPDSGFFLDFQSGGLAILWFHYREDGSPEWWTIFQPGYLNDGSQSMEVDEWSSGGCLDCVLNFPQVSPVGQASLFFASSSSATLTWEAGGLSGVYHLVPVVGH